MVAATKYCIEVSLVDILHRGEQISLRFRRVSKRRRKGSHAFRMSQQLGRQNDISLCIHPDILWTYEIYRGTCHARVTSPSLSSSPLYRSEHVPDSFHHAMYLNVHSSANVSYLSTV